MADDMDMAAPQEADDPAVTEEAQAPKLSPIQKLEVIATQIPNIAAILPEEKLGNIAIQVVEEYQIDKTSRSMWEERISDALDLAMMVAEQKDYPFEKASNIKYPLLTVAALQFNARAYPAIVQGDRVAKCKVVGRDPQGKKAAQADRVSEHLSYQLLTELPEWEEDTDKLLVTLPIIGSAFRKVWYDPALKRNRSRLVSASSLVVNYFARSMEDVPRITEELRLYPYEIAERIRAGRFIEFDYANAGMSEPASDDKTKKEGEADPQDKDAPQLFLEQHRLLDLDEDGYPEPYVVTVHHASQKVCRVAANFGPESITVADDGSISAIRRNDYFVKYQFLPSPDGGFYGQGFGWLLKDISETINTTLNMIADAAHLSNVQGGLVSSQLGIKEKAVKLKMGEWRVTNFSGDLRGAVFPIKYDGPSPVLFQLLGTLIESGKEVAAIKDVLTGDSPATAPVGTTLAVIEQGLQVFTSIYKRVHRALKAELKLHARLNAEHLDPQKYQTFFDEQVDPQADYNSQTMDILPVSDPNSVSKMQRIAKAQLIREVSTDNPTMNPAVATRRILEAAEIDDVEELMLPPPQPNPEEEILKRKVAMNAVKEQESKILMNWTAALKNVADAEAKEEGTQVAIYSAVLQAIQGMTDGQGRVPGVEGQSGDTVDADLPEAGGGGSGPGPEAPPVLGNGFGPAPMGGNAAVGGP